MRLYSQEAGNTLRARKDERPNLQREGKLWRPVTVFINEHESVGLISEHWLYFGEQDTWYKINLPKYDLPTDLQVYSFSAQVFAPLTEDEKKARKKARRIARRMREKEEEQEEG